MAVTGKRCADPARLARLPAHTGQTESQFSSDPFGTYQVDCADVHEQTKAGKLSVQEREVGRQLLPAVENKSSVVHEDGEGEFHDSAGGAGRLLLVEQFSAD